MSCLPLIYCNDLPMLLSLGHYFATIRIFLHTNNNEPSIYSVSFSGKMSVALLFAALLARIPMESAAAVDDGELVYAT